VTGTAAPSNAAAWFRRIMWLGIGANVVLALPTLLRPIQVLSAVNLPVPSEIMWTQFAALLLILLSLLYIPAAIDPYRYRIVAVFAVASRLAGVLFFFLIHRSYWPFGAFDLAFFLLEAILLMRLSRTD
jgi:hypothetical protein